MASPIKRPLFPGDVMHALIFRVSHQVDAEVIVPRKPAVRVFVGIVDVDP